MRPAGHPSATPSIRPADSRPAIAGRAGHAAPGLGCFGGSAFCGGGERGGRACRAAAREPARRKGERGGGTAAPERVSGQGGCTDPGLIRNGLTSLYQLSLRRSYSDWHWPALASVRKPLLTKSENACTLLPYIQHATL